jgi:transposase
VAGLLADRNGFPLEIGCFEGNQAEKLTILPVIRQFQARHGLGAMVVVADAGMLPAANLDDLDEAGLGFIVGSRVTKAPAGVEQSFRMSKTDLAARPMFVRTRDAIRRPQERARSQALRK